MTKKQAQTIAAKLAHSIMTTGAGATAERLVLENDKGAEMAGWAEAPLARHIEKFLLQQQSK
jgi:hypothetical protein